MARPPHLAVPVAVLAAVVVLLRSLQAFEALHGPIDLLTLTYLSRIAWSLVAVVGFTALGYAYATGADAAPAPTLAVAAVASLVGVLAGNLVLAFAAGGSWGPSLVATVALVGTYSVLDAATFGLMTLAGAALGTDEPR